jgi:hypothetical protein
MAKRNVWIVLVSNDFELESRVFASEEQANAFAAMDTSSIVLEVPVDNLTEEHCRALDTMQEEWLANRRVL